MEYPKDFINQIINGNSLDVLKLIPDNSIDSLVTDPPYGYSFLGRDWDKFLPDINIWKECFRVMKAGSFGFIMSAPRQDVLSKVICQLESAGFYIDFSPIYWAYSSGFPKAMNISKKVDSILGHKREILEGGLGSKGGHTFSKEGGWKAGQHISEVPISNEAMKLNGSYAGFQPKPAVEVIIVIMKPLEKANFVKQAMDNQKGITWMDEGRIPYSEGEKPYAEGRFPANLLVSDSILNEDGNNFSRYFDLDLWVEKNTKIFPFLNVKKPSKSEKQDCKHPTIKPIQLMSYLVTLSSKEGDIVLDPFVGSGTTAVSAKLLKRNFIGIELEKASQEEALKRLKEICC